MDPSVKTARFGELWHAWPRVGRTELAKSLGGKLHVQVGELVEQHDDDSPIRLSSAFNHTGHPLPTSTVWSGEEVKDKDGFRYMVHGDDMKTFLTHKLGKPKHIRGMSESVGQAGILLFEGVKKIAPGGMHFTLWDGTTSPEATDFWTEAENVVLWSLPHDK